MPALGARIACCDRLTATPDIPLCPTCAPTRCGRCEGLRGHHSPRCDRVDRCRGCGVPLGGGHAHYCAACRTARCPECRRYARQHRETCRYAQRQRRAPRLTTVYTPPRVFEDNLVELFNSCYQAAVRFTHHVGRVSLAQAEDCVSQVFLWIWSRKDVLPALPTRTYVFRAALNAAASVKVSWHTRQICTMDIDELIQAEEEAFQAGLLE
jgi:hypothetical protein